MVRTLLPVARRKLDQVPADTNVLQWWPRQQNLGVLFPLAKMLFAIPASSADNERSFSSAGFTMGPRRTRTELEAFRAEHRIRRFLTAGADAQSHEGREMQRARVRRLLERFAELVAGGEDEPRA